MVIMNSADAIKNWSEATETVIKGKPIFIEDESNKMILSNLEFVELLLSGYTYSAKKHIENDKSITLSLNEIDLVENASTEDASKTLLAKSILEYAENFYYEYQLWSSAPNKQAEIPYIFKALVLNDVDKIKSNIKKIKNS